MHKKSIAIAMLFIFIKFIGLETTLCDVYKPLCFKIEFIKEKQALYLDLLNKLQAEPWKNGDYKRQLINAIGGICLTSKSTPEMNKTPIEKLIDHKYLFLWFIKLLLIVKVNNLLFLYLPFSTMVYRIYTCQNKCI